MRGMRAIGDRGRRFQPVCVARAHFARLPSTIRTPTQTSESARTASRTLGVGTAPSRGAFPKVKHGVGVLLSADGRGNAY